MKGVKISFLANGIIFSQALPTDVSYILEEELIVILAELNKLKEEDKVKFYKELSAVPSSVILSFNVEEGKYDTTDIKDLTVKLTPYLENLVEGGFGFDLLL